MRGVGGALMATIAIWCGCYKGNAAVGDPCSTGDHACPSGQLCDLSRSPPTCVLALVDASATDSAGVCIGGCAGDTPVCDATTNVCRGCVADAECPDDACIESTGTCVAEANVLYVEASGTGSACTRTAPCPTISKALALVSSTRSMIRVAGGTYSDAFVINPATAVDASVPMPLVISGPSPYPAEVTLDAANMGARTYVIEVDTSTPVTIEGLTLANAENEALHLDPGATATAFAIATNATSHGGIGSLAATLTLLRANITADGNGISLQGGLAQIDRTIVDGASGTGLVVNATAFVITNSMFVNNQNAGVEFQMPTSGVATFAFDTIAANLEQAVKCSGMGPVLADSIIASDGQQLQLDGCTAIYSLFDADASSGNGNINSDPLFVSSTDFHIQPTSPAVNAADPTATDPIDIDGQARPIGPRRDIGADEAH